MDAIKKVECMVEKGVDLNMACLEVATVTFGMNKPSRKETPVLLEKHVRSVQRWWGMRENLFNFALEMRPKKGAYRMGGKRPADHQEEEDFLYVAFRQDRLKGLKRTDAWLREKMAALLERPNEPMSSGWVDRFKKRYNVKMYMKTVNKTTSVQERLPKIQQFQQFLQDDIFGGKDNVAPEQIFYMDEVPHHYFGSRRSNRSLSMGGETVFLSKSHDTCDKRMATLVITICAGEEQTAPLGVIFRGKSRRSPNMEESVVAQALEADGTCVIYYQEHAWADTVFNLEWLERFHLATQTIHQKYGFRILGSDQHSPRLTVAFRKRCEELNIFMVFGPAECTDVVAPVDAHVGVHVKNLVGEMYHEHMDSEERDKEFTDSERRVHLMQWSKAAWLYTKTHNQRLLREAFIKTGYFPLAADHSEDRMVKIKDMPDYLFRPPLR